MMDLIYLFSPRDVHFVIDRNVLNAPLVHFFSGYAVDVLCRTLNELWLLAIGVFRASVMIGGFLSQVFTLDISLL